jgi:hypothetical protein
LEEFSIDDSNIKVRVGSQLLKELKAQLVSFLWDNSNIFAWSHEDLPETDPSIMIHKLNGYLIISR